MKIVLINPTRKEAPSFGILYLASVLEGRKHSVKIVEFDEPIDNKLFTEIDDFAPDIIGITVMSYQLEQVKNILAKLPAAYFIAGGRHATALPEEVLDMGFDLVVRGEAEESFPEVLDNLEGDLSKVKGVVFYRENKVINTGIRDPPDITKLPRPAYHLVDMEHYLNSKIYGIRGKWLRTGWVFTSRGCPGRCTFCYNNQFFANKYRTREVDDVIKEIQFLKEKYKIEALWVLDDTFTLDENRVVEFCEKLKKANLGLQLDAQTRVNTFTDRMAKAMKEAGFVQVEFGVESGSQKILDYYKKGTSVEQAKKAFSIAHKYGFTTFANFIVGAPGETEEDIRLTKALIKELKPTTVGCSFLTAYPGTALYDEAIKNNWIKKGVFFLHTSNKPQLVLNSTEEELIKHRNEIYSLSMGKTAYLFLKQPKFWKDMIKITFKNPLFPFKVLLLLIRGKSLEAINVFKQEVVKQC